MNEANISKSELTEIVKDYSQTAMNRINEIKGKQGIYANMKAEDRRINTHVQMGKLALAGEMVHDFNLYPLEDNHID